VQREKTITIPLIEYKRLLKLADLVEVQAKLIAELRAEVESLKEEIQLLKCGRKSRTSSTPSSHDYTGNHKNNTREKSTRKSGGQKGHQGSNLKMSDTPDKIIKYQPSFCNTCGEDLSGQEMTLESKRQEIDIPPIIPIYIEHQSYSCLCPNCTNHTKSELPSHLKANIQYGENIQAIIAYMAIYQLIPAKRLVEFLKDILSLSISQGTVFNVISTMSKKASPVYESIRTKIQNAKVVGSDETGMKVNGGKGWIWVFQNSQLTYIAASLTRGFQTILDHFSEGFLNSVYISDSLSAQLKTNSLAKQLCLAHLLRELNKFEEVFDSDWAKKLKTLFKKAIAYKKTMVDIDFNQQNPVLLAYEEELTQLLEGDISEYKSKEQAFINRLRKRRDSIFTFLYHKKVPPDNNGSERAIRNVKVKMKISNQFKSLEFAQHYAVIRSVIDTTTKNAMNVFDALRNLANQAIIEPAE
jgi:transposase